MKLNSGFLTHDDGGSKLLVSTGASKFSGLVRSNETAGFIIKCLEKETTELLKKYHDNGKNPNPIAKGMSWMKTNVKVAVDDSDHTIADLVTEGCNMGIKSLQKYLNEFKAANDKAKHIAQNLIDSEDHLIQDMRAYL